MDMKKTAKKIAALVAGTTMLGATIMGATALDLSNYPAPFVTNGVFSGKIVVGSTAKAEDIMGAIDLAASLQAASTSETPIDIPGAAGVATVTGDAAEFKTGSDILSLGEKVSDVKQTFTSQDLDALKSGVLDTGAGSTAVNQYLKFASTNMKVQYTKDSNNDVVGDFLSVPADSDMFEYHMEFQEGAESEVSSDKHLTDLEDEVLTILGAPYTVTRATITTGKEISLEMLGGQVAQVLRDGETKTFDLDGKNYEVTALFISDNGKVKLQVNGLTTKELASGDTQVLGGDVTIGIQSVLTNNREGIVEFYLGANKLKMVDSNYTNSAYVGDGAVTVGKETVDNEDVIIKATDVDASTLYLM